MIRILNISIILFNLVFPVQDTIRIATYNVLNYSISNSSDKTNDFRLILEEIDPDILIVQEMINSSGATYFKNSVLNLNIILCSFVPKPIPKATHIVHF